MALPTTAPAMTPAATPTPTAHPQHRASAGGAADKAIAMVVAAPSASKVLRIVVSCTSRLEPTIPAGPPQLHDSDYRFCAILGKPCPLWAKIPYPSGLNS